MRKLTHSLFEGTREDVATSIGALEPPLPTSVTLYDLIETNRPELYQVVVDARGAIELPQLGRIQVYLLYILITLIVVLAWWMPR